MAATPLLRNSWKLGWRPDQDLETGNPEGPLRMQNVTLEEDNCLSLAHGMETVQSGYSGFVHTLYSKFIGPVRYDFAGTSSGDIYVSGTASPLVTGGSTSIAAFDTGLGFVYLLTGTQRKKYSPDISVPSNIAFSPLGISRPLATDYAIASYSVYNYIETTGLQPIMEVGGTYTISGVSIASNFNLPSTGGVAWGTPYDMENLYGTTDGISFVLGEASDPGNDLFTMQVKVDTASSVASISVSFYGEDFNTNDAATKFTHTWVVDGINVALFDDSFVTLKARRRDFTTDGPANITWNNIYGVFVGGAMTDPTAYIMGDVPAPNIEYKNLRWQGGLYGQLSGYYEYAIQAVSTNPFYVAKSPLSPTTKVRVFQGTVTVNTAALAVSDAQITEIWIYRRSVPDDSANVDAQELGYFLTQFYKVGSIPYNVGPIVPFSDTTSDRDALVLNIVGNQFLQSVSDLNATGELYGTVETANGRRLYMTYQYLYVSDILNPDAIDSRFTLKASDLLAEKNLFVTRQPDGSILLGTTKDFYRITGTFVEMQDNILDVVIQALGEEHPPICHQFANDGGSIIYTGNDGVRITSGGGESQLLSVGLKQLYEGESRYQLAPVAFLPNDNAYYPVASAHGKIFAIVPLMDGSRTGFVYDLVRKYWFQYDTDPFCLEVTEDGYILGGYNNNESSIQRLWNPLANTKFDGSGQYVDVWIAFDDNGQPRNRKDTWTFKMIADTGGVDVNILIAKDGSNTYYNIGPISFNGKTERLITIANTIALGKKFSIRFTGQFSTFKLYHYCIEYDPRPEQLTFIRIPYNNLGTQTRKRFVNYAFVIDTLGTTCEFFPFVDGTTAGPSSTFVMDRKGTYIHFFNENEEGIDIGGIICGFFEFAFRGCYRVCV